MIKKSGVKAFSVVALIALLVALSAFALTQGSVNIALTDLLSILKSGLGLAFGFGPGPGPDGGGLPGHIKPSDAFIVLQVRMPRIILAALVGGTLSIIGTAFQAIFRNPMADPYVMGISSGAAFGATLGIVLGFNASLWGMSGISLFAFIGALVTVAIVYFLASAGGKVSTMNILLAGIVLNAILSALISLMMLIFRSNLEQIVVWTMGSFNAASWEQVQLILLPLSLGVAVLMFQSRELNAMLLGEEEALNMGVNVERTKKIILVCASFLAAFAVSVSGIIGFVGLIIPHLFRMIFGANHKVLVPISFVGGAAFLLFCDTLARSIVPNMEVPVGIITAAFGGPFFLFLLYAHKRKTA